MIKKNLEDSSHQDPGMNDHISPLIIIKIILRSGERNLLHKQESQLCDY
ncbi:hypothetical protein POPTR_012G100750v4 [Populus trichocarpa]|uniref:Uncharacterized protein n=1 Tax=Populus trichocarpa TaxID=3694 RepID=A0ACC0S600_POPTR|nr:hypothetical protein BDE02_12G081200 [Populus trichocarpa]KAI9384719.1 hypothetical protein POPTR_012G100750v4 [Populus trichocarpa]